MSSKESLTHDVSELLLGEVISLGDIMKGVQLQIVHRPLIINNRMGFADWSIQKKIKVVNVCLR